MSINDVELGCDVFDSEELSVGEADSLNLGTNKTEASAPTRAHSDFGKASSISNVIVKPQPPVDVGTSRSWPEGDGLDDFILEERKDFEAHMRAEADYGFGTFKIKAFMFGGPRKLDWVIPGWVPRGEVCIFAAERGLGKTALLMQMLLSVSTGQPFLGIPVESGIVVGLFHEDSSAHLRGRFGVLFDEEATDIDRLDDSDHLRFETRDYDKGAEDRRVLWDNGPTRSFYDLELRIEAVGGVKLLVIDTLKRVLAGDVDKGENVRHFVSALQGLADRQKIAIVMTTHINNQGKTAGSSELENQGRSVFHLVKTVKNGKQATLTSIKLNCGPDPSPIPLEKTPGNFWCVRSDAAKLPAQASAEVDAKGRSERLRAILHDVIDNHPKGLSTRKTAPLYAPRFAAGTTEAPSMGGSRAELVAEFEIVMAEGLRTGEIVEEKKDTRHSTKVLRVADRARDARGPAQGSPNDWASC